MDRYDKDFVFHQLHSLIDESLAFCGIHFAFSLIDQIIERGVLEIAVVGITSPFVVQAVKQRLQRKHGVAIVVTPTLHTGAEFLLWRALEVLRFRHCFNFGIDADTRPHAG